MQALELKIPPAVVWIVWGGAMWLLSRIWPDLLLGLPGRQILILAFCGLSAVFVVGGVWAFRRARTTVDPTRPDQACVVVRSGVYRISRNPMYLGFLLALTAWWVYLDHLLSLSLLPLFVFYLNRFQIVPEERAMTAKFGRQFLDYTQAVRRWL